jgi:hypothetical protein
MRYPHRLGAVVAALAFGLAATTIALADTVGPITFEPPLYTLGPIDGQDGWQSDGAAGSGCAPYDHKVAAQSLYPSFGTQSLRMSNAVTSGCFGDQTFSKPLANEAGETSAASDGMSTGPRQPNFEASWQFASTVPAALQPGLSVVASPDRGDGARMSWVQMADTPTGLEVNFFDYQDNAPFGTAVGDPLGCGAEDDFVFSNVASGLDRTVPHTIRITMEFVDGPRNDVVKVYVDGVLGHTGTSWEDYFRYCEGNPTRTVDSILFRTGGAPAPATLGNGFLIDNLTLSSGAGPTSADQCKNGGWENFDTPRTFKNQGDCIRYVNTGK